MEIKDRLTAMAQSAELDALELERLVRYGADQCGRHRHGFAVRVGGRRLADVLISPGEVEQEKVDRFAGILYILLNGSEARVQDAESRVDLLRRALSARDREIADLKRRLADFERTSRGARGPFYAAETAGKVWLNGQPSWDAFGLCFASWHDLATAFPGLRPCGVQVGEGRDAAATFIVMRPIADLALVAEAGLRQEPG